MKHVMIDLETMGLEPSSPIVAIGAVRFNPETGDLGQQFYKKVDLVDAVNQRRVDGDTLKFWLEQDKSSQLELIDGTDSLKTVLEEFAWWIKQSGEDPEVWGNGATFDITMLEDAFKQTGVKVPWYFRHIRDVRTIAALAKDIISIKKDYERVGIYHKAIDDAIFQAIYVSDMWQVLRVGDMESRRNEFLEKRLLREGFSYG